MADRDSWCLIALVLAYAACAGSSWSGEACASPKSALKQINTLSSPQELLAYVETRHDQLDTINLATILYRLARLYTFIQVPEQRVSWKLELQENPNFAVLLRAIGTNLAEAQAALHEQRSVQGINAWCMSNLLWSLVKLEVAGETSHVYALALAMAVSSAPLVVYFLKECSGQGLGNLLWSYVQIPGSPEFVQVAIIKHMSRILESNQAHVLDAHALSTALWSIAHVRHKDLKIDKDASWCDAATKFLYLAGSHCLQMLSGTSQASSGGGSSSSASSGARFHEDHLLYQATATTVWSYSVILGSACGVQEPFKSLLLIIRQKSLARLQLIVNASSSGRQLPHTLSASFNGQTLSNLVEAYDTANMLTPELLQAIFDVAAYRLGRPSSGVQGLRGFKPEDLATLLRYTSHGADSLNFVTLLSQLIHEHPQIADSWSTNEVEALKSALELPSWMVSPAAAASVSAAVPMPHAQRSPAAATAAAAAAAATASPLQVVSRSSSGTHMQRPVFTRPMPAMPAMQQRVLPQQRRPTASGAAPHRASTEINWMGAPVTMDARSQSDTQMFVRRAVTASQQPAFDNALIVERSHESADALLASRRLARQAMGPLGWVGTQHTGAQHAMGVPAGGPQGLRSLSASTPMTQFRPNMYAQAAWLLGAENSSSGGVEGLRTPSASELQSTPMYHMDLSEVDVTQALPEAGGVYVSSGGGGLVLDQNTLAGLGSHPQNYAQQVQPSTQLWMVGPDGNVEPLTLLTLQQLGALRQ